MGDFANWFKGQDFYTNMRFIHGDRLFDKDGDVYRVLPVQIAYQGWNARQSEIDELKAQLECCRKENAVLLGKVKDTLDELESALSCCESTETECVLIEIREPLRGAND